MVMAALRHVITLNVDIKVAVLLLAIEIVKGTSCIKYYIKLNHFRIDKIPTYSFITVHGLNLFHDW